MFKAYVEVFAIQQRVRVDDLVEGQHFRLTRTLQICVSSKKQFQFLRIANWSKQTSS